MSRGWEEYCTVCGNKFHNTGLDDMCPSCEREIFKARLAEGDVKLECVEDEYTVGVYEDRDGDTAEEISAGKVDTAVKDFSDDLIEVMDSNAYCTEFEFMFGYKGVMDVAYSQGRVN